MVEETDWRLDCPATFSVPVASKLEEEAEARVDWPVMLKLPANAAVPVEEILSIPPV